MDAYSGKNLGVKAAPRITERSLQEQKNQGILRIQWEWHALQVEISPVFNLTGTEKLPLKDQH